MMIQGHAAIASPYSTTTKTYSYAFPYLRIARRQNLPRGGAPSVSASMCLSLIFNASLFLR